MLSLSAAANASDIVFATGFNSSPIVLTRYLWAFLAAALRINEKKISAVEFWNVLKNRVEKAFPEESNHWNNRLNNILNDGNLAMRILDIANNEFGKSNLKLIYQEMSQDLEENRSFGL